MAPELRAVPTLFSRRGATSGGCENRLGLGLGGGRLVVVRRVEGRVRVRVGHRDGDLQHGADLLCQLLDDCGDLAVVVVGRGLLHREDELASVAGDAGAQDAVLTVESPGSLEAGEGLAGAQADGDAGLRVYTVLADDDGRCRHLAGVLRCQYLAELGLAGLVQIGVATGGRQVHDQLDTGARELGLDRLDEVQLLFDLLGCDRDVGHQQLLGVEVRDDVAVVAVLLEVEIADLRRGL